MTPWFKRESVSKLKFLQTGLLAVLFTVSSGAFALGDALNGQKIYPTCVSCHNVVKNNNDQKINNAGGVKTNQGVPSAITTGIRNNPGDMGKYAAGGSNPLSATQLADMAAYVNAVIFDNCLATPGTGGITGKTGAACSTSSTGVTTLAPTSCAAQTLSWTINSNTCDASAPATKIGLSATLNDAVGPTARPITPAVPMAYGARHRLLRVRCRHQLTAQPKQCNGMWAQISAMAQRN
jgi:cytochrome c553